MPLSTTSPSIFLNISGFRVYIMAKQVINIVTASHFVYLPRALAKRIIDKMPIIMGPTILISPSGMLYPTTAVSLVPKKDARSKLIFATISTVSKIKSNNKNQDAYLVDGPSVL